MPRDRLRDAALWAVLLVPVGLLHAWVLAELGIAVTDVMFLVAMVRARDAAWLRRPWMVAALAWWGWLMICSLPVHALPVPWQLGIAEAVVVGRLLLFTAALEHWVLRDPPARLLLWWALALSCLWIGVECWQQYFTGTNMFGDRRFGDGSLTGPFVKPRAGQLYAHLLYIAMLPPVVALFGRGRSGAMWGGALAVLGVVTSVRRCGAWRCWRRCWGARCWWRRRIFRRRRTPSWWARRRAICTISGRARMASCIRGPR